MSEFSAPSMPAPVNRSIGADTPIVPVAITLIGAYLAWFGVRYWRTDVKWPSDPVKAILTGKPLPPATAPADQLSAQVAGSFGGGLVAGLTGDVGSIGAGLDAQAAAAGLGARIAAAALKYKGAGYRWGGIGDVPGDWDCSSYVSKVLGQDLGLKLPGGGKFGDPGYPPHAHGPGSTQYMLYGQGVNLSQVMPGDLVVSVEHIGIVIGPGQMISAMDPTRGTDVGTFPAGFPAGPPVYRRPIPA